MTASDLGLCSSGPASWVCMLKHGWPRLQVQGGQQLVFCCPTNCLVPVAVTLDRDSNPGQLLGRQLC